MSNIPVFYYHSIAPVKDKGWYKSYLTMELKYFEDFLKYLFKKRYEFLFLDEYFEYKTKNCFKTKKIICLTFDDGYLDNFVYVYPLLKKYNAKGTIFVSPEYVQKETQIRPTLEDLWDGKVKEEELMSSGFVNWNEMLKMEESKVVEIQSHTMTHTKYFASDKIREFHHPKSNYLNPISNLFPERKPYYILDKEFKHLLPYGTPFFEEKSAMISRRVYINEEFNKECISLLSKYDFNHYNFEDCFEKIKETYENYKKKEALITHIESSADYEKRIRWEISESKRLIENHLNKKINHICWPHGDYNNLCHEIAREVGYKSSHIVLKRGEKNIYNDRFDRTGSNVVRKNRFLTLFKAKYKLGSYTGKWPYSQFKKIYSVFSNSKNGTY